MKIGVVGCGALGSYYGAKLIQAGQQVHFLLRSDYDHVQRAGVQILSPEGGFHVHPICASTPSAIGPCDLVVIGLKTTANDQLAALLPDLIDGRTALLTLQNGLGNEEHLARLFGAERVLGGLCFVCLNRIQPGVIHHLGCGEVKLGEFQRPPQERTEHLANLFREAHVPCHLAPNLEHAHWQKLVWNIPFNGLGVAGAAGYEVLTQEERGIPPAIGPCLSTGQLLGHPGWTALVCELMAEVISVARGLGFPIRDGFAESMLEMTRAMGPYRASTLIDFERGKPIELESLFLLPLRHAQRTGVPTPRLARLCRVLQQLDAALPKG